MMHDISGEAEGEEEVKAWKARDYLHNKAKHALSRYYCSVELYRIRVLRIRELQFLPENIGGCS